MDPARPGGLTGDEARLLQHLPAPPPLERVAMSHLWIVDWSDDGSGAALQRWLDARRHGWSRRVACRSQRDVAAAIRAAAWFARSAGARPILHLEARCGEAGPEGPGSPPTREVLPWRELARHLRRLNIASGCHLVLAVAAAHADVASRLLACGGDRIPCVAVIGADAEVPPAPRLAGMKALYRHWMDGEPGLEPASSLVAPARMGASSMVAMAHARLLEHLLRATRPGADAGRRHAALMAALGWPDAGSGYPASPPWPLLPRRVHKFWQSLFMIDLHPDNRARFDFDARAAAWDVLRFRGLA